MTKNNVMSHKPFLIHDKSSAFLGPYTMCHTRTIGSSQPGRGHSSKLLLGKKSFLFRLLSSISTHLPLKSYDLAADDSGI